MRMALGHRDGRLPIEKIRRFMRENPGTKIQTHRDANGETRFKIVKAESRRAATLAELQRRAALADLAREAQLRYLKRRVETADMELDLRLAP